MVTISLETEERDLLVVSLQHCLETCRQGGITGGCTDCEKVGALLEKVTKL